MSADRSRAALELLEADFELLRELGRGATAVVHLARERSSGLEVAIKLIRPQFLDDEEALGRFAREARYVSQLDHPNVVRMREVRDLGEAGLALIMTHVSGSTLRQLLRDGSPLPVERAERIMRDIAHALAAAHEMGIIHRDVKPENIFLDANGTALLADFGIARSMTNETQQLTMSGVAIGTPTYMAPEQIDGGTLDGRGDIYSLGLTAWEMLSGRRPWDGEALYSVLYHQKHAQVADVRDVRPGVPDRIASAIAGSIEKDRELRWQSARELLAALDGDAPLRDWPSGGTAVMETVRFARAAGTPAEAEAPLAAAAVPDFSAPEWSDVRDPSRARRRMAYAGAGVGLFALILVVTAVHAWSGSRAAAALNEKPSTLVALSGAPQESPGDVAPPADAPRTVPVVAAAPLPALADTPITTRRPSDSARTPVAPPPAATAIPAAPASAPSPTPPSPPATAALRIVPGGTHTCLVSADGTASCWGGNERGQLGTGAAARRAAPSLVSDGLRFTTLAAGMWHSCAVARDGAAWCWGMNDHGQLGEGSSAQRATPVRVSGGHEFRTVVTGVAHSCALETDGEVWCWGANDAGQLGTGTTDDQPTPVRTARGARYRRLVAGWRFNCALDAGGRAACWGEGSAGQLGDGVRADRRAPVPVSGGRSFAALAAGSAHACGVTPDGALYCWGSNAAGQLGDGTTTDRAAPVRVGGRERFVAVAAGAMHSCAVTEEGAAYCWGRNTYGQLGDGGTDEHSQPQRVAGGHAFAALSAFGSHTCGTTVSGEAFCWGFNLDGQLGDGSRTHRTRPVYVERPGRG